LDRAKDGEIDVAWVVADKASVFASEKADKATGSRLRFETVRVYDEKKLGKDVVVRVSADGEPPVWMRARDLSRPRVSPPPPEVTLDGERWIDVDLAQQALVAYEGK